MTSVPWSRNSRPAIAPPHTAHAAGMLRPSDLRARQLRAAPVRPPQGPAHSESPGEHEDGERKCNYREHRPPERRPEVSGLGIPATWAGELHDDAKHAHVDERGG